MTEQPQDITTDEPGERKKVLVISAADALVLEKKLRRSTKLCNITFVALLVMLTLHALLGETFNLVHWLVSLAPLLIFIPAMRQPTHRTYSWLCFVLLMYFLFLVPLLMSYWSLSYWLLTLLVTLLFITAMMTSRWLQYWNYYLSNPQHAEPQA